MADTAAEAILERARLHGTVQSGGTNQMQRGIVARVDKAAIGTTYRMLIRDKRRRKHNESLEHELVHAVHPTVSQALGFQPAADPPSAAAFLGCWTRYRQNAAGSVADTVDILVTPIFAGDRDA